MGIFIYGDSGTCYEFSEVPWSDAVFEGPGVYLVAGSYPSSLNALHASDVRLYVGKAKDLHQRVVARVTSHHRYHDFVSLGAHRLFVWYANGLLQDEGTVEQDVKLALRPPLNDELTKSLDDPFDHMNALQVATVGNHRRN